MMFTERKATVGTHDAKMPTTLIIGVVVVCALPFLLNLAGFDFGTPQYRVDPSALSEMEGQADFADAAYRSLRGAFAHTLLEWSAFCTAIFTVILAFVHFRLRRDPVTPIIGVALFCAGCMDAFHTIAADHLINAVADIRNLIPFTWAICRVFNALIMIAGIGIFLLFKPKRWQGNFSFVLFTSLIFGLIAYGTIYLCATSASLPQTMYPDSVITRPWDVAPLVLYLFAGLYLFPLFFRRRPSLFSHALIISIIPQVATQLHMAFGSTALFDNHFNIAHFLKILAYFVPYMGLTLDYVQTYRQERLAVSHLESVNEHLGNEIDERRRVEEALRESEEKSRAIVSTAAEGIITIDEQGTIKTFNPAAERIFGYAADEVVSQNVTRLMPEPFRSAHDGYLVNYLETGIEKIIGIGREVVGLRKDGRKFPMELAVSEIRLSGSRMFAGIVRDITERREAEEALAQTRQYETEVAARIQETLLLGKPPENIPGIRLAALTIPSQTVDGDFYDFRQFRGDKQYLDIVVGDVMGKGIPAALLGAATKGHLERTISSLWHEASDNVLPSPERIVNATHRVLVKELISLESFVTLFYARFAIGGRHMNFVDCGHPNAIHYRQARNECVLLSGENMPLGVSEEEVYTQHSAEYDVGDLFLFYSDGVTEARNEAGDFFGDARLRDFISANNLLQPTELLESLRQCVVEFSGSEIFADDMTCVAVKITHTLAEEPLVHTVYELSSELEELAAARAFLRRFCGDLPAPGMDADDLEHLEIAFNEALANIIQHAYSGRSGQKIEIVIDAYADRVRVNLYNWGKPLEDDGTPPPVPDGSRESGFGLYLIAQSVDEVRYTSDEEGRNCISLVKRLPENA